MALDYQARELARAVTRRHSNLKEAILIEPVKEGQLHFSDGTAITIREFNFLTFGYSGTGSSAFSAFLSEAGFSDTDVANVDVPLKLLPDGKRIGGAMVGGNQVRWEDGTVTELLPPGWKYEYPPR